MRPNAEVLTGLITIQEVCRIFGKTRLTVKQWRDVRGLPYVLIPGDGRDDVRYRRKDVLAWAKANKVRVHRSRRGLTPHGKVRTRKTITR